MKLVCVECKTRLSPKKLGVHVLTMFGDPPQPYQLWSADIWQCPICDYTVCANFGAKPVKEHFEKGFEATVARAKSDPLEIVLDYELRREMRNAS